VIALGGCAGLLLIQAAIGASYFSLPHIQLVVFPLVLFLLWKLRILGRRVPKAPLMGAMFLAILASGYSYLYVRDEPLSFVVAKLEGDDFEARSRQFRLLHRAQLRRIGGTRAIEAQRTHESFRSHAEALRFLNRSAYLPAVVWGNERWVTLTLHPERTRYPVSGELKTWLSALGLQFVESVPVVGLSIDPEDATAEFLSRVLAALLPLSHSSIGALSQRFRGTGFSESGRIENELMYAANQQAPWNSFAHRAYPWWLLGNLQLTKALHDGRVEKGELECAIRSYTQARRFIGRGDNPELLAAALNNRAVAQAILGQFGRPRSSRALVKHTLRVAVASLKEPNLYGVPFRAAKIARANLKAIRAGALNRTRRKGERMRGVGRRGDLRRGPGVSTPHKARRAQRQSGSGVKADAAKGITTHGIAPQGSSLRGRVDGSARKARAKESSVLPKS
jgi:hypothetical protein